MSLELIQKKIENMEGYVEVEGLGIVSCKEWDKLTDPEWDKTIEDYQEKIEMYKKEYGEDTKKYEEKMIEISNDLMTTRKAKNKDYLENQELEVKYFTKHDYEPIEKESSKLKLKKENV